MEDDWFLVMCYRSCRQRGAFPNTKSHLALVNVYRLLESLFPCRRMCATMCQVMILVMEADSLDLARRDIF